MKNIKKSRFDNGKVKFMARPPIPTLNNKEREELLKQDLTGRINVRGVYSAQKNDLEDRSLKFITNWENEHIKLALIEDLLIKVAQNKCEFIFDQKPGVLGQTLYFCNKDANQLVSAAIGMNQHRSTCFVVKDHVRPSLNPRLACFYDHFHWIVSTVTKKNSQGIYFFHHSNDVQAFYKSLEGYQNCLKTDSVTMALKKWRSQHRRNQESLTSYIDELLDLYGNLYVINMHLGFNIEANGVRLLSGYDQITEGLKKLLHAKHRNPMWKDDLVGHIWKVEHVEDFGFTVRLLLFYRGETSADHQDDANEIALRWLYQVTEKRGVILSRDPRQNRELLMPENVGKLIKKEDADSINELKRYLNYLLQIENLFGVKGQAINVFNKGYLPKQKNKI